MRISIVGAGAWGTALALIAAKRHDVRLHARSAAHARAMRESRENVRYLPGFPLPPTISVTSDLAEAAADAELIVVATPVSGLRETGVALAAHRPRQIVCAERIVHTLHGGAVRVYRSSDVIGVEVGGAVKNVLAIAAGICDGLELGANARAALLTRGLSEMMRYGVAVGGSSETLMGLTGVGDLILTCTGALSRNRRVGLALGQGRDLPSTLEALGHVAEGVHCARAVKASAETLGLEMPITVAVAAILFDGLAPRDALGHLLARAPRHEH